MASDFTRFLLKRDLLMSRFNTFNDKPEYYPSWKESFKNIAQEIMANPSEEIDLIIKWTGPQSQTHVQSIKASNLNNPPRALQLIWTRLDERFGSPELIDNALKTKLNSFPRISNKDYSKLYELSDILSEISSVKENANYGVLFSYFDSSIGVSPIVSKLPYQLQDRWTKTAVDYNARHGTIYPPFYVFANFIREQSRIKNNPSFLYENPANNNTGKEKSFGGNKRNFDIRVKKNDFTESTRQDSKQTIPTDPSEKCPIHGTRHSLNECRSFKSKPIHERKRFLKEHKICFKCCASVQHMQRDCPCSVKCNDCGKTDHTTALHIKARSDSEKQESPRHGGESGNQTEQQRGAISSRCTQICFDRFGGKSCAKIILVKAYVKDHPSRKLQLYAMLDDQSNRTLGKSKLFDYFGASSISDYVLSTCSGKSQSSGRKLNNLVVESLNGDTTIELSDILECDQIPDIPDEIPTREVAMYHSHLNELIDQIPPLDSEAKILLLIGRDTIKAHHVQDQIIGPSDGPYAQKLPLGWTIIGETCLGKVHRPDRACVKKTYFHASERLSIFPPCTSEMKIDEMSNIETGSEIDHIGSRIFIQNKDDNKPGLSRDDREFLAQMEKNFQKDADGNWSAPLPFRNNRQKLPNNKIQAFKRAKSLDKSLRENHVKREHFFTFMKDILERGHAEIAPEIDEQDEQWYLPIFGIYHPKKPGKLRAVFDSSAKFDGVSLNDVLLSGPDLANSLLGVLLRFRREAVGVMADIEQMFYCFKVHNSDRNYLKFLWYTDNDFDKPLTVYRMTVHVFGNSPSPAIATYGLRKTADEGEAEFGSDMKNFVSHDFYVDDGLTAQPTATEAIDLMKRTQSALKTIGNLRLHKISSNNDEVMKAFKSEDLAKELKDLDLNSDALPAQRSLGIIWDLESDFFMYSIDRDVKPYTRRGILSTINSIYDPLGFLAPITIEGKLLLRSVMTGKFEWDEPLPPDCYNKWESWRKSLFDLETLKIPRMYGSTGFSSSDKTIHIYCDASEKAVAAVGYVQLETSENKTDQRLGFVIGKAKVAPIHAQTIPRLELCGALLATELGQIISDNLHVPLYDIRYYTDSRVVLGYINNSSRRFYNYVSNRIAKIHQVSEPSQWSYIHTERNPADIATRSIAAEFLQDTIWLSGPSIDSESRDNSKDIYPIQDPENDGEIRPEIVSRKTVSDFKIGLGSQRFERYDNWKSLVHTIALLKDLLRTRKSKSEKECSFREAELYVIKTVQQEFYEQEFLCLENGTPLRRDSTLLQLNPFIDIDGIMRVGGRIRHANICSDERNPIILPSKHWIATLIVRFYHSKIQHQGRHFTSGAVRSNGYWIVGEKRLISSIIHKCVTCRKLRRPTEHQKIYPRIVYNPILLLHL